MASKEETFARRTLVGTMLLTLTALVVPPAANRLAASRPDGSPTEIVRQTQVLTPLTPRELELERQATNRARERDAIAGIAALALGTMFLLYRRRADRASLAEQLSVTDPLTGLKNRRYLYEVIDMDVAASIRHHRDAAVLGCAAVDADLVFLLLDIDHFKRVNDEFGHAVGDQVLSEVAGVLRRTCRDSDAVVRWGGEEFLIVGRFTDRVLACATAERICRAVEGHLICLPDGRTVSVTCSVGFAAFPFEPARREALSWERVVALADLAAYSAKRQGRNRWVGYASAGWIPPTETAISMDDADAWVAAGRLLRLTKEGDGSRAPQPAERELPRLGLIGADGRIAVSDPADLSARSRVGQRGGGRTPPHGSAINTARRPS